MKEVKLCFIYIIPGLVLLLGGCGDTGSFGFNPQKNAFTPTSADAQGADEDGLAGTSDANDLEDGGDSTTSWTDQFTQAQLSQVDILWVIDSSGSMGNEQASIQQNAGMFTSQLTTAAVDFRLGIISTGAGSDNELKISTYMGRSACNVSGYITKANASKFADCAVIGTGGSGSEEGLEGSRRALDSNYVHGKLNEGFLRPGIPLHMIIVSDEEDELKVSSWPAGHLGVTQLMVDQLVAELSTGGVDGGDGRMLDSRESYLPLLSNHKSFFDSLMTNGAKFTAHALVKTSASSCSSGEIGKHYMDFATMTGGSMTELCGNWAQTMEKIGLEASGLKQCFQLNHPVTDPALIVVSGTPDPGPFTYNPVGNQICFSTNPPAGTTIQVSYQ